MGVEAYIIGIVMMVARIVDAFTDISFIYKGEPIEQWANFKDSSIITNWDCLGLNGGYVRKISFMALDNVSFDIQKGEILGLLGPNGAGKTTAIRALSGLIDIDAGDIELFGQKQDIGNRKLKREIGLVTQEITVFNELTAEENLKYFGGLYGLKGQELAKRVKETLEFVGLTEHAKKYPKKFLRDFVILFG
jgi:ABC-type multidrug transport system ATPase subunit